MGRRHLWKQTRFPGFMRDGRKLSLKIWARSSGVGGPQGHPATLHTVGRRVLASCKPVLLQN